MRPTHLDESKYYNWEIGVERETTTVDPEVSKAIVQALDNVVNIEKSEENYTYSPLEPGTFRLLDLELEGNRSRIPHCRLRHTAIASESYTAISYTWLREEYIWYRRPLPACTHLYINGRTLLLPSHVALILALVFEIGIRTIWIDIICINQIDKAERGHQVACMGQIFRDAFEVITFLGKPTVQTDSVLEGYTHGVRWQHVLSSISGHKYWYRAWVLQEIGLSRRFRIFCGNKIPAPVQSAFLLKDLGRSNVTDIRGTHLRLIDSLRTGFRPPLLKVLLATKNAECVDPRDTVYAKFHLAEDGNIIGEPNYMDSAQK